VGWVKRKRWKRGGGKVKKKVSKETGVGPKGWKKGADKRCILGLGRCSRQAPQETTQSEKNPKVEGALSCEMTREKRRTKGQKERKKKRKTHTIERKKWKLFGEGVGESGGEI